MIKGHDPPFGPIRAAIETPVLRANDFESTRVIMGPQPFSIVNPESPSSIEAGRRGLLPAGQKILQGGKVFIHVFQAAGDAHGHAPVKFGR